MKTQKLLVIVVSIGLMAFFNVLSFAQTAPGQPALAGSMAEVLAQSLEAQGYDVERLGNSLKIATDRGELSLDLSATGEELEYSGIGASLVPEAFTSAEDTENLLQLQQCLDAVDFFYDVNFALCDIGPNDFETLICETEAAFERVLNSLKCIALYAPPPPPPSGDEVSVFVTSDAFDGNLGGLAGADAICQAAADAAQLGGTWTAWLSTSDDEETETLGINAIDRIPDGQYQLLDGTLVANNKADLTDGLLKAAINMTESGVTIPPGLPLYMWTGTGDDGTNTAPNPDADIDGNITLSNCNNWTDNSSEYTGSRGIIDKEAWTYGVGFEKDCSDQNLLYCFGGVE